MRYGTLQIQFHNRLFGCAMSDIAEPPARPLPATIKAAIIEDRRDLREGLTILINGTPGYRCVGSFRSMEEALPQIGRDVPDVARPVGVWPRDGRQHVAHALNSRGAQS